MQHEPEISDPGIRRGQLGPEDDVLAPLPGAALGETFSDDAFDLSAIEAGALREV
jgi:hypothetical protein